MDGDYRAMINETQSENDGVREKVDEIKKDQNKKLSQIYRELEKIGMTMERKVNTEDFNERLEVKADKQMLVNAICNKVNKQDVDQAMATKMDIKEIDQMFMALETKFETELGCMNENINRKSNTDEFQYYRKELNFKLDKSELEVFRQEYVERLASFEFKLSEKNQLMNQFKENIESRVDTQVNHLK